MLNQSLRLNADLNIEDAGELFETYVKEGSDFALTCSFAERYLALCDPAMKEKLLMMLASHKRASTADRLLIPLRCPSLCRLHNDEDTHHMLTEGLYEEEKYLSVAKKLVSALSEFDIVFVQLITCRGRCRPFLSSLNLFKT